MIRLELTIGDLTTSPIFHVIESKTSYNLMLRRPWLHEHEVAVSTLHQCRKHYRDGENKINGDIKRFTMSKSHFIDAKLFKEDAALKETTLAVISSTRTGSVKNAKETHIPLKGCVDGSIKPQ